MPEISIIVPVYNTEKYLRRCVHSILDQTFTDFELILVDDGSPDNCGAICDEYARADHRIRVIHQSNRGAAAARNAGIDEAEGRHIAFCDSDDIVSSMWLERLVTTAGEKVLPVGAFCADEKHLGAARRIDSSIVVAGKEYPRECYFDLNIAGLAGFLWNALYRREIINRHHIRLRELHEKGDYNEDLLFTLNYIRYIDSVLYTGYADYLYNTHENSLSRGSQILMFEKYAEKYRVWSEFIKNESSSPDEKTRILSTTVLYFFLTALRAQSGSIREIKRIVLSNEVCECISKGDTSKENPLEIKLIREKKVLELFTYYQLIRLKEKIKP